MLKLTTPKMAKRVKYILMLVVVCRLFTGRTFLKLKMLALKAARRDCVVGSEQFRAITGFKHKAV